MACDLCDAGGLVYQHDRDCCRARWLSTAMIEHGDAMLDRWQKRDELVIGAGKAKAKRKALIEMAKQLKAGV